MIPPSRCYKGALMGWHWVRWLRMFRDTPLPLSRWHLAICILRKDGHVNIQTRTKVTEHECPETMNHSVIIINYCSIEQLVWLARLARLGSYGYESYSRTALLVDGHNRNYFGCSALWSLLSEFGASPDEVNVACCSEVITFATASD